MKNLALVASSIFFAMAAHAADESFKCEKNGDQIAVSITRSTACSGDMCDAEAKIEITGKDKLSLTMPLQYVKFEGGSEYSTADESPDVTNRLDLLTMASLGAPQLTLMIGDINLFAFPSDCQAATVSPK